MRPGKRYETLQVCVRVRVRVRLRVRVRVRVDRLAAYIRLISSFGVYFNLIQVSYTDVFFTSNQG